jgi:HD-GYP domain-containing protein (c-di-GMP phosphodiesterase class II)
VSRIDDGPVAANRVPADNGDEPGRYWEREARRLETEAHRSWQREQRARAALETAQDQLLRYAEDVRATYHAERARRREIQLAYLETIRMLAAAVEARDPYTGNHLERVTHYTVAVASVLGWGGDQLKHAEMGAILHDIGKINIRDAILNKPGPLTPEEWEHMKTHPVVGSQLLKGISFLAPIVPFVRCHHERFDGGGYPDGLKGKDIPVGGRLIAVADTFDAITTRRPYQPARSVDQAVEEITRQRGRQFDPEIVEAFLTALRRGDLAPDPDELTRP